MSTHSQIPTTATCHVCGRPDRTLTKAGQFRHHTDPARKDPRLPFGQRCEGSGETPQEGPMTAGCGCQYDAGGRAFVDHCVCPDASQSQGADELGPPT